MSHRLLLDSGFGRYLVGKRPKAIANDFLFFQPSLVLWADELVCDSAALGAEASWADRGFLESDLSIRLADRGVIRAEDFGNYFQGEAITNLLMASKSDSREASTDTDLLQYVTPDPADIRHYSESGFEHVNALLYLSALTGFPHLNTRPAARFYEWKFDNLAKQTSPSQSEKELAILSHILSFSVPGFELFPRNDLLLKGEAAKHDLLLVSTAYAHEQTTEESLTESYNSYLKAWLEYGNAVRPEVMDNFDLLLELREDKRLKKLRTFLKSFADSITHNPDDSQFPDEVQIRLQREILEVEHSIVHQSESFNFLDKCASYISFPFAVSTTVAGAAATVLTQNPLFLALGMAPEFLEWSAQAISDFRGRRFSWHLYLVDFKNKVNRMKELRSLDKRITELSKSP